ncbi:MAG: beta-ketoacyl-ACP reductase [Candidatus Dormiibacterota bacterium]
MDVIAATTADLEVDVIGIAARPIFAGRVAIVTGGTRGIGAAISTELAQLGAHVAASYRSNVESATQLQEALAGDGGSVSLHLSDVGQPEDCERLVREVIDRHGKVDFLVNNAGITVDRTVRRMTVEDWHAVMRTNVSGAFYMIKAVLEPMLERGYGRIINISSVIGQIGNIGQANYAAAKAGLFGLTQSLAQEVARKGITVNTVSPGFIGTEMVSAIPPQVLDGIVQKIPMRRLGTPEEVARVVRFLLEDGSSYITGAMYTVNGGLAT